MKRIRNVIITTVLLLIVAGSLYIGIRLQNQALVMAYPINVEVPTAEEHNTTDDTGILWQEFSVTTLDSLNIEGWYTMNNLQTEQTIIVVHGIGGSRLSMLAQAEALYEIGNNIIVFDLRNHGSSDGEITRMGFEERLDILAVVDFVENDLNIERDNIVLYGHSLGGVTTIFAASELSDLAGIIIETAYTDVENLITDGIPPQTGFPAFPFDQMLFAILNNMMGIDIATVRPIDVVSEINAPIFYMHSRTDIIIPYQHSETLAAASQEATVWLVEESRHCCIFQNYPEEWQIQIETFLDNVYVTPDEN